MATNNRIDYNNHSNNHLLKKEKKKEKKKALGNFQIEDIFTLDISLPEMFVLNVFDFFFGNFNSYD